jgi:hypothetical protein
LRDSAAYSAAAGVRLQGRKPRYGDAPVLSGVVATPQSQDKTPLRAVGLAALLAAAAYRASGDLCTAIRHVTRCPDLSADTLLDLVGRNIGDKPFLMRLQRHREGDRHRDLAQCADRR